MHVSCHIHVKKLIQSNAIYHMEKSLIELNTIVEPCEGLGLEYLHRYYPKQVLNLTNGLDWIDLKWIKVYWTYLRCHR